PAAVATSSDMPRRRLIKRWPARAADTELDVAITVVRLIAAATVIGRPSTRFRKGTTKMPPPRPSVAPKAPAATPAIRMTRVSPGVTAIKASYDDVVVGKRRVC